MPAPGGVPERPKGTGCKPVGSAFRGSNPLAPTSQFASPPRAATGARLSATALLAQQVEHLHGKEGVDGSSPSEGFVKGQQMAFFVPRSRTRIARGSPNLSPRSVPNISGVRELWLEQRRL